MHFWMDARLQTSLSITAAAVLGTCLAEGCCAPGRTVVCNNQCCDYGWMLHVRGSLVRPACAVSRQLAPLVSSRCGGKVCCRNGGGVQDCAWNIRVRLLQLGGKHNMSMPNFTAEVSAPPDEKLLQHGRISRGKPRGEVCISPQ